MAGGARVQAGGRGQRGRAGGIRQLFGRKSTDLDHMVFDGSQPHYPPRALGDCAQVVSDLRPPQSLMICPNLLEVGKSVRKS